MELKKIEYKAVDFLKFVFCIAIIAIHTNLFYGLGMPYSYYFDKAILRIAVPFFFVTSGFFLGKSLAKERTSFHSNIKKPIQRYICRLLKPYLDNMK